VILVVEMSYHLALDLHSDSALHLFGIALDAARPGAWVLAFVTLAAGALSFGAMRRRFAQEWGRVQAEIEGAHRS
jgi:branched-chain amino acid transport system permease protein